MTFSAVVFAIMAHLYKYVSYEHEYEEFPEDSTLVTADDDRDDQETEVDFDTAASKPGRDELKDRLT